MRNSTILLASALLLGGMTAQAQSAAKHFRINRSVVTRNNTQSVALNNTMGKTAVTKKAVRKAFAGSIYKPQRETVYEYLDGEWVKASEYVYTYNAQGNVVTQTETSEDGTTLTEYAWSEDGLTETQIQKIAESDDEEPINSSKLVLVHDPILPDLVVEKKRYEWDEDANAWVETADAFRRDITRDADNNLTSLTISVPYNGAYDAIQRYTNTVDPATKQIATYKFEELGYNGNWRVTEFLRNLKWAETNGQLVSQFDEWMQWGNKLLTGNLCYTEDDGEVYDFGSVKIDYKEDGGFHEVFDYTDVLEQSVTDQTMTDDNGSFVFENKVREDLNEDGKLTDDELTYWEKQVVTYDSHKNLVEEEAFMLAEGEDSEEETEVPAPELEKIFGIKYDYVYDADHGDVEKETVTSEYDYDEQDYVPNIKVVVNNFVDIATGIKSANSTDNSVTAIYNLQGARVSTAEAMNGKGLYIVKKGNRTIKVMR